MLKRLCFKLDQKSFCDLRTKILDYMSNGKTMTIPVTVGLIKNK